MKPITCFSCPSTTHFLHSFVCHSTSLDKNRVKSFSHPAKGQTFWKLEYTHAQGLEVIKAYLAYFHGVRMAFMLVFYVMSMCLGSWHITTGYVRRGNVLSFICWCFLRGNIGPSTVPDLQKDSISAASVMSQLQTQTLMMKLVGIIFMTELCLFELCLSPVKSYMINYAQMDAGWHCLTQQYNITELSLLSPPGLHPKAAPPRHAACWSEEMLLTTPSEITGGAAAAGVNIRLCWAPRRGTLGAARDTPSREWTKTRAWLRQ
ncbi:hypothetical protein E2C01_018883 [Portunus trituberculatus]|uniref:Uncharacterized protein n=1 Tax=Portunus trituberculatus TaxID=210409 RepID=A0A5B7DXD9_PORTR|nr:hypothetical protein [Portunus trituberculatus]